MNDEQLAHSWAKKLLMLDDEQVRAMEFEHKSISLDCNTELYWDDNAEEWNTTRNGRTKMKTIEIADGIRIYASSIIDLELETTDYDADGYLASTGNRKLMAGIATRGDVMVFVETDGGYLILSGDPQGDREAILAMGDNDPSDDDDDKRIADGKQQWLKAVQSLHRIYSGNDYVAEELDWIEAKIYEAMIG